MTPSKNDDLAYCKTLDRQECPALLPSQDIKTAIGVVKRAADDTTRATCAATRLTCLGRHAARHSLHECCRTPLGCCSAPHPTYDAAALRPKYRTRRRDTLHSPVVNHRGMALADASIARFTKSPEWRNDAPERRRDGPPFNHRRGRAALARRYRLRAVFSHWQVLPPARTGSATCEQRDVRPDASGTRSW